MSREHLFATSEPLIKDALKRLDDEFRTKGVSFDIDGVEIDSATSAINEFNKRHNTLYRKEDLNSSWGIINWIRQIPDIKDPKEYAIRLWNSQGVMSFASPESGAWILSYHLHSEEIGPLRISARPYYLEVITKRWYEEIMPWVDQSLIHICSDESEIGPRIGFKINKINSFNIEYHFEDQVEDAELIAEQTKALVVLVPQPWNVGYKPTNREIIEVKGYTDQPVLVRAYLSLAERFMS